MAKKKGIFQGWSALEYGLLGFILLLCLVAGVLALFLGGYFVEEELAQQNPAPTIVAGAPTSTVAPLNGAAAGDSEEAASETLTLNPAIGAPGTTVSVQGAGWPAQSRVVIYLAPVNPPRYAINSVVVDETGQFEVDIIVPSDPRWLNESPVPVLAETEEGSRSAQALLNISSPDSGVPEVTVVPVANVTNPTPTPTLAPPAANVAGLTVNAAALNVRKGPGTTYDIVGVLVNSQQGEIIGRNADSTWWQIKFPGAREGVGWVSAAFVTAQNISNVPIVNAPPPPPPPPPTPTPVPNVTITDWRGEYYNNPNLQGAPVLVRNDRAISFDWGLGSPAPEVPMDNFSVRWSRDLDFPAGRYRFYARTDDGVRIWIDGALLINQWRDTSPTTYLADVYLSAGVHNIRMEYYERNLGAVAVLSWERADDFPDWRAEYYNNVDLSGQPVLVRNEPSLRYNWGSGSPASQVPADNFSARWTRRLYFDSGDYVMRVRADDGVRVWVDNALIFDEWRDGFKDWMEVEHNISGGLREIRVEYYERSGDALIELTWWRRDRPDDPPEAIISAPSTGLVRQPVTFDGSRSRRGDNGIARYEWEFGDGSRAEGKRVSHTYSGTGEYRVRLRVTDKQGLQDSTTVRIRIDQDLQDTTPPIAEIVGPGSAQVGDSLSFDGSRSLSLSPITRYDWSFGDGTTASGPAANHTYQQPGTYDVRLVVVAENGLRGSASRQVRVDSKLTPAAPTVIINAPDVAQVSQAVSFKAASSKIATRIVSYDWNFGDGGAANGLDVPHTYTAPGTYNVTLTVTDENGQSGTTNKQIQITDPPAPDATPIPSISGPSQARVGDPITFDGSGSQSATPIDDGGFQWQFGDGGTASGRQVTYSYQQPGNYNVILLLIDQNGQSNSTKAGIRIDPLPQPPQAVISGPDQAVAGQTVSFDANGSQASSQIAKIEWDLGDGTTATDPVVSHTYQSPGSYQVALKLTDQDGLEGATTKTIQVTQAVSNNPPVASISAPATAQAGQPVDFDGSGSTGDTALASYAWDFGDGTAATRPRVQHTYSQPGSYNVTLKVTDSQGLPNSSSVPIRIDPAPVTQPVIPPPQASISGPDQAGAGDTVTFDGSVSTAQGTASYDWDFGDGNTGSGPTVDHAYSGPGTYDVTLTVTNESGSNKATRQIAVQAPAQPQPQPQPTAAPAQPPQAVVDGPAQGQVGEGLLFDGAYSQSDSPIDTWLWDFGDGTTDTSNSMGVGHVYSAPGSYTVQLTVTDQNGLQGIDSVVVQIDPQAVPQPQPAQPTSTPASAQPTAAPAQPPQAVVNGPAQGQVGEGLLFDGAYSQSDSPIDTWLWDFGDGTTDTSNSMGVGHAYNAPGSYNITLTITDQAGQSDSATFIVQIDPAAVPQLQPTPTPQPAASTPTPVPVPTDTPVPAPTDTPVPAPTDTPVPPPTETPVPPVPTDTPVPPPPTDTPVPVPTDTPVPAPTATPVPPPPTDTPTP